MQINRLFEIIYILLDKKTITAKELSEHFEVSQRTIYRDIDVLGMVGIPVYTNKGKGGGISILPEFVLNKSLISDIEQNQILSALQSLNALDVPNIDSVLNKLTTLFKKNNISWIDVDFSYWGSDDSEKEKFEFLRNAIVEKMAIEFEYYNSCGEKLTRIVEPLKIVFKGQGWYLYGYCRLKEGYRIFKIKRIKNFLLLEENFNRDVPQNIWRDSDDSYKNHMVTLVLKIDEKMAYRLFDEFNPEDIERNIDGSFKAKIMVPESDWIYGYVMSYGEYIEVLEPKYIRDAIVSKYKKVLKKYL